MTNFKEMIETRAMGTELVQVNLYDRILGIDETNGLLDLVTIFPTSFKPNPFEVAVGGKNVQKAFIGDIPTEGDIGAMRKVKFSPKPVAVVYSISKELINDNNTNLEAYVVGQGIEALVKTMEEEIFSTGSVTGTEINKFQAISKSALVSATEINFNGDDVELGYVFQDGIKSSRDALLTSSNNNLNFILSKRLQDVVNSQGESAITYDNLPNNAYGRLLGKPSYSADLGAGATLNYITSIAMTKKAYGLALSPVSISMISGDTINALPGSVTFIIKCMADGKVLDEHSVKVTGFNTATPLAPATP